MGKMLSRQIRGLSFKTRVALVFLVTALSSIFMYEGWYKPAFVQAAATIYNFTMDSTAVNVGRDGSTSTGASAIASGAGKFSMITTTPATRSSAALGTNTATTAETVIGTVYGPQYAAAQYLYTPTLVIAGTRSANVNWKAYVYDYDPAAGGVDTPIWTSNATAQTSGSSTPVSNALTFTAPAAYQIPAGHRVKIVVKAYTGSGTATASLWARYSSSVYSYFSVNESPNPPGPAPTISALTPSTIGRGASNVPFTITGTNFDTNNGVTVTSSGNATMGSYSVVNATTISGYVSTGSASTSASSSTITVTNKGDGQSATSTLTLSASPGTTSIAPTSVPQGYTGDIAVTSSGLTNKPGVSFSGSGVTVNSVTYNSATSLTVNVTVSPVASTGTRDITIVNPDFGTRTTTGLLTLTAGLPAISSLSPAGAYVGTASQDVAINGSFFVNGATVAFGGSGITVKNLVYNSSSSLTATVSVADNAPLGAGSVTVKNPNGDTGTPGVFTVLKHPETIVGPMTFSNVTQSGMTVNQNFSGDANNSNTCTISYGTVNGSYPNSVAATKGDGVWSATLTNLPRGVDGAGVTYYFKATFGSPDGFIGTNVATGSQSSKASQLMHNSQNLGSDKWAAQGGWGIADGKDGAYTCSTCHAKGTGNAGLVSGSILGNQVVYQQALGDDSAHTSSTNVCEVCHSQTAYHRKDNSVNYTPHKGSVDCTGCHEHNLGFAPDSVGGKDCLLCHDTLSQGAYHHALDSASGCLNCHADHNIFRADLNSANSIGRAANLKLDTTIAPAAGAPGTTYSNTDFVSGATGGGICVSCHQSAQTKSIDTSTPNTLPIGKDSFAASAHNYAVASAYKKDNSSFQSNCSKCHNDTTAKKYQAAGNQFGTHGSDVADILSPLGGATPDASAFCMRCHSRAADQVINGGTYKSQDTQDWYGAASMAANAVDTFASFYTATTTVPVQKAYGHIPGAYANGLHTATETLADVSAAKHVECADCHNAHQARPGSNGQGVANGNLGSPALIGAMGVQVPASWPANWTAPAQSAYGALTQKSAAGFEWQVCFKCHSGANANVTAWGGTGAAAWTDLGLAFNPNNKSAHPVVVSLNNQVGSTGTKALAASQMVAPWKNVGTQTMTCSDCHATDSTGGSLGPHGSGVKWMLSGTNKAWPYTDAANNGTSSGSFFTISNQGTGSGSKGLFCKNCHDCSSTGHGNVIGRSDHTGAACVNCHIRVPHGGKVSRLMTTHTAGLPARFAPDGNGGSFTGITGFTKANGVSSYSENGSCKTDCGHHSGSTGSETW
ncbi:hypothetical protein GMST_28460 [Geomonas silvestris]|uniref:Outer membrane cytochrome MtrC/MtrF-like domain-containing protein n=1 Tax=Geomonas silvestris TaxID=2740184 RepID=A0A6V8MKI3_9BACT|nr:cytochrome c3 family protein [Geomonas silvestris]GFO60521.1 hypothetical protein GMST_28460 [Geomonas silvestris]